MAIKQGEKDYLEEHSKKKIEFLEKYFFRFLSVLINSPYTRSISYYDVFCGIGIYKGDGSKGSPVVAFELARKIRREYPEKEDIPISILINDGDHNKVEMAKAYIETLNKADYNIAFEAHNEKAQRIFQIVENNIKENPKGNHLVFIDPHGYKEIYKGNIKSLMNLGKVEILIFLPVFMMYRFLKPTKEDKENPSYRPLKRFMQEFEVAYDVNSVEDLIENIRNAFSFKGEFYTTAFELETDEKNKYALIFVTKNLKGLEKAVEAKWEIDTTCGKGHQKKESNLFSEYYEDNDRENCLKRYKAGLTKFMGNYRNNNEIYLFTLKEGYLPKHTNMILKELENKGKLLFDLDNRSKKKTFYLGYRYWKNKEIKYKVKYHE